MSIFNKILGILKNIFSRSDWARTVKFKLIDAGPIVREKYVDLHNFGDQILYQKDTPDGIKVLTTINKGRTLEVIFNKEQTGVEEIKDFLNKYKIEVGEIEELKKAGWEIRA